MSNMTPEELREKIEIKLLWMTHTFTDSEKCSLENNVLELLADLCGEVIGKDDPTDYPSGTARKAVQIGANSLRVEQRTRLTKLTGKEIL